MGELEDTQAQLATVITAKETAEASLVEMTTSRDAAMSSTNELKVQIADPNSSIFQSSKDVYTKLDTTLSQLREEAAAQKNKIDQLTAEGGVNSEFKTKFDELTTVNTTLTTEHTALLETIAAEVRTRLVTQGFEEEELKDKDLATLKIMENAAQIVSKNGGNTNGKTTIVGSGINSGSVGSGEGSAPQTALESSALQMDGLRKNPARTVGQL